MTGKIYKFDGFTLDPKQRKLLYQDNIVQLSARAFEMLALLVQKQGEIVEKDELLQKVWIDSFVEEGNLAVHICALRRVLGEKRGERKFLETISGRGYSFVCPVQEVSANQQEILIPKVSKNSVFENNLSETNVSIAVLPFVSENKNTDLEYLASGITQSLIDNLSQISNLKVIAYSAVRNYNQSDLDLQEAGFLLGAKYLLVGRISEYKNNLEINVELIHATDKRYIWGMQSECEFKDIFQVKKEISLAIADKLKLRLGESEKLNLTTPETLNSDAFKLYLKGKHILDNYQSAKDYEKSLKTALKYFEQAIEKDRNYALAYVGIARIYHNMNIYGILSRTEVYEKCQKYIQLALNIDKNISEAYVTGGIMQMILQHDFAEAENSFKHAIQLNPNNARAYHFCSFIYVCKGEFQAALSYQNKALQFDPTSVVLNCGLADRLLYMGKYREAIIQAEETLELHSWSLYAFLILARAYAELGMFEEAFKNAQKALESHPSEEILLLQGYIYALTGETEKAKDILGRILDESDHDVIDFADVARVYSALGETGEAFRYLEKAFTEGSEIISHLKVDPGFRNLHRDSRFESLLQKLKLDTI